MLLPLGHSDFREVREKNYHYVDKTGLISELLADPSKVVLWTRPRRFGKTLNLTMLWSFLDCKGDHRGLFQGLAVSRDPAAMSHCGAYPTLFLSFKDLKPLDEVRFEAQLAALLGKLARAHRDWLEPHALYPDERARLTLFCEDRASLAQCEQGLAWFSELFHRLTQRRVVILIDEYDTPINATFRQSIQTTVIHFMRNFLSAGLKDNPALEKGILTGILRVAKDSIFSGLNNLSVYGLLDTRYAAHFGFSEAEVQAMATSVDMSERVEDLRTWFNGYTCGEQNLYNPWSVVSALQRRDQPFTTYWTNAADQEMVRELTARAIAPEELNALLQGKSLARNLLTAVSLGDLQPGDAWSLLFHTGMLTVFSRKPQADQRYQLRIPNREVATIFQQTVVHWLGGEDRVDHLIDRLLLADFPGFTTHLRETVAQVLSFHDTGKDQEAVYHLFMAGLLARLQHSYEVSSNRESGYGRFDLALIPKTTNKPAFLFEFKRAKTLDTLQTDAQEALAQILSSDYAAVFRNKGIETVHLIGIGWHGKQLSLEHRLGP